ncbi:MAG: ribosomal protein S18-alanine N-acetyltransferase [Mariprofundales bacterium]
MLPSGHIRPATAKDIDAVYALNCAAFAEAWQYPSIRGAQDNGYDLQVYCTQNSSLIGYYLGQDVFEEAHIMQIAITPSYQHRGAATVLMEYIIREKIAANIQHMWLEVRRSNHIAQQLYLRLGFQFTGVRPAYYSTRSTNKHDQSLESREDALMMQCDLAITI